MTMVSYSGRRRRGLSRLSSEPALAIDEEGMLYTGGNDSTVGSGVVIRKFNPEGEQLWAVATDSLMTVHSIHADTAKNITVLASYTRSYAVPVNGDTTTIQLKEVLFYHTLRIDKEDGSIEEDEHNVQFTGFLSDKHIRLPILQEHYVHYFLDDDTIFIHLNWRDEVLQAPPEDLAGCSLSKILYGSSFYTVLGTVEGKNVRTLKHQRMSQENPFSKTVEIEPSFKTHKTVLLKNELQGFTLFLCGSNGVEFLKYDKDLNLKTKQDIRF